MKTATTFVLPVILLAAGAVCAQTCAVTTAFEATLLPGIQGDFGIAETEGTDINETGEAVGLAFAEQPVLAWRAVRWPVGATEPQILSEGMGRVNGLADNRVAAGEDEAGGSLWDADNERMLLPGLTGHLGAVATDVNSSGIIVGWSATAHDLFPAAWPDGVGGEPIDLADGVPAAFGGLMRRISERGIAVGEMSFFTAPFERAVVWNAASGAVRVLRGLIGFNGAEGDTTAIGVNERGVVVGQSYRPLPGGAAAIVPVAWRRGQVRTLPLGGFGGGTAYDINDCGTIVGEGIVNVFDVRAVIWQRGTVRQLDDLHAGPRLGLISAVAINNAGQILVNGGAQQTWILTPVQ
jgi:uncharacterized membrane protein